MPGLVERERAYSTVHEGAVYLHLGDQFAVTELDLETRTALGDLTQIAARVMT